MSDGSLSPSEANISASSSDYSKDMEYPPDHCINKTVMEECPEHVRNYVVHLVKTIEQLKKDLILTRNKLNTMKYTHENQIEQLKKQLSEKTRILSRYINEDEVKGNAETINSNRNQPYIFKPEERPSSLPSRNFAPVYKSQNIYDRYSTSNCGYNHSSGREIPETLLGRGTTKNCAATQFAMGIDD